jgi:hypothetical protein
MFASFFFFKRRSRSREQREVGGVERKRKIMRKISKKTPLWGHKR